MRREVVPGSALVLGVEGRIRRIVRDELGICWGLRVGDPGERIFAGAAVGRWREFLDCLAETSEAFDWRIESQGRDRTSQVLSWAGIRHGDHRLVLAAQDPAELVTFCGARTDIGSTAAAAVRAMLLVRVPAAARRELAGRSGCLDRSALAQEVTALRVLVAEQARRVAELEEENRRLRAWSSAPRALDRI